MKTKFILFVFLILILFLATGKSRADLVPVDTSTPHVVGSTIITGDPLATAFAKLNASIDWLKNYCDTNGATNAGLSLHLNLLATNLLNTSNLTLVVQAQAALFPAFTNWFFPDYYFNVTNFNGIAARTLPLIIQTGTNTLNLNFISNLVVNLNGNHIQPGTINSNRLDAGTLLWLQSCDVAGVLTDATHATGTSGDVPKANGDGTWTWAGNSFPDITDDGAGHVGFNNASPGYSMDALGSGYITARLTGTDNNRAAFLFGSQTYGVQYEFGIDATFSGGHDFYIYDSAMGGFIMQIDSSHNTTFGNNVTIPGQLNSDSGNFYSDGSGNIYAQSFNPISDRARKENIKPFDPQSALQMALALTNYTWRFKGRTNLVSAISRTTNSVSTNLVAVITPATGKEFGPMAQDWHQVTGLGGGTNISMTSMAGLLLGAVQGLGQKLAGDEQHPQIPFYTPPASTSTTFGYGAGLLACDAKNLYVSVGTNTWCRISLPTNAW